MFSVFTLVGLFDCFLYVSWQDYSKVVDWFSWKSVHNIVNVSDFHQTWRVGWDWTRDGSVRFWDRSGSGSGTRTSFSTLRTRRDGRFRREICINHCMRGIKWRWWWWWWWLLKKLWLCSWNFWKLGVWGMCYMRDPHHCPGYFSVFQNCETDIGHFWQFTANLHSG